MLMVVLEPDPRVARFAVAIPSTSKAGLKARRFYDVALLTTGYWSCECWPFLRAGTCTHVLNARTVLSIVQARGRRGAQPRAP